MAFFRDAKSAAFLAAVLVALPFASSEFVAYQIALFLIYGIAAQGVALCWGRLGFLPLGHALFFGLGAYLFGGMLKGAESNPALYLALPVAVVAPALLAYVIARLVFARSSRSGPYFSLITLALTMLGFLAAQQWSGLTGGFNGMANIPDIPGTSRYETLYWLVAAVAVVSTLVLAMLAARPIGVIWEAVAQNEERLQLLGYATDRVKANAYAFSALLAAAAGALFSAHQGIATPQAMSFILSTEFVIWAAVGGKGSSLGPLLGATVVGYASAELREQFLYWEVAVAALFIVVVLFLPNGVAGLLKRRADPRHGADSPAPSAHEAAMSMAPVSLILDGVKTAQSGMTILDGLSLALSGPGIRCVIGPNGAGKTSSFNVITGRLPLLGGGITLNGHDIGGLSAWRVARKGIGRKMQVPSVFPGLTVRENLGLAVWAGRASAVDTLKRATLGWHTGLLADILQEFPALASQLDAPAGTLAQGHRQALELAMTLLPEPKLVLLDEPCAGLSPGETHQMIDAIKTLVSQIGAAALLIEHDITAVDAMGGDVYVLHQGRLLDKGSLADIQSSAAVRAVYAGGRK
ncbi:branched-chain amino acid transport system permease protein [Variovorax boronicumulans]|uniref:Branched-chain amino acid transport system permease protein n=1 Tax=Variovorax boronicumulans TaxID=436515 RepID=A0AAW8DTI7_9BURK|nr:ATP-binding cassette domain-containing protein [Variovorax boronicumulans]MDP9877415.1 branched-chain amino acid transport system permease protein [Variovorax boronicumulans]MDP9922700.1 branched-chain amino acid transport system permease protein [Variovorax boronicumulans]